MTWLCRFIFTFWTGAAVVNGAQKVESPQVVAAVLDARQGLERQIFAAEVTRGITVGELINSIGGRDELLKTVESAQQVGGTRWLDDQTPQVRLVIDGAPVARALEDIIAHDPSKSPLPPAIIHAALSGWRDRAFSAVGASTAAAEMMRLRPPLGDAVWAQLSDADRGELLSTARDNAVTRLMNSLRPMDLRGNIQLNKALDLPDVRDSVEGWLAGRPVTAVEFRDDGSVRLTISTPSDQLWTTLHAALLNERDIELPTTDAGWDWLMRQVQSLPGEAVGVANRRPKSETRTLDCIPLTRPEWANRLLETEATAPSNGSKLHTARAAEGLALVKLRQQLDALPLSSTLTLGAAAARDPRVEQGVLHTLNRTCPNRVDYQSRGAVTIHVTMNLADLWSQLADLR